MDPMTAPSKPQLFIDLIGAGERPTIHFDARKIGVVVPPGLRTSGHEALQYGRNLPIPIDDMEVTVLGVRATLSFGRVAHLTYVPWCAVFAVTLDSGRGIVYRDDVPADVQIAEAAPAKRTLQSVPAGAGEQGEDEPRVTGAPVLRVVKPS